MEATPLLHNDQIVTSLRISIHDSDANLANVPGLLKRVLAEGCWRERVVKRTGQIVTFERFDDFVTTPPLEGLGATPELVERLIRDDPEALTMLAEARAGKRGGDHKSEDARIKHDNIIFDPQQQGTAAPYTLRRLKRDAPALHARVVAGKLSANAAAIEAGFREKTITVPLNIERAAATIKRHFKARDIKKLIDLLSTA